MSFRNKVLNDCFSYMVNEKEREKWYSWKDNYSDWRNDNKERNSENSENWKYNCGGYALGTYSWYKPYDYIEIFNDELQDAVDDDMDENEIKDNILNETFEQILRDFKELKEISEEEIDKYDRVIAYRIYFKKSDYFDTWDWDFHFRVKENGIWTEKCGGLPIQECEYNANEELEWDVEDEDFAYNSSIRYLAYK